MEDILVNLLLSLVNFLLEREHKPEILRLSTDQNEALPQPICPKCDSSHTIKMALFIMERKNINVKTVAINLINYPVRLRRGMEPVLQCQPLADIASLMFRRRAAGNLRANAHVSS
jgi:hypothetical protein